VARNFDRDKLIDALLEGARRDPDASSDPGPACLEAEELAAWADGGLDAESVHAIEVHVADCPRCQALSTAMFSSGGTAAAKRAEVVVFPRSPGMDWLPIAIGTIAATVVIWLGVGKQNELRRESTVVAENRPGEAPGASPESRQQEKQKQEGANARAAPQGNTTAPGDAKRVDPKAAAPVQYHADRTTQPPASTDLFRKASEPVAPPPGRNAIPPPPAPAPALPPPVLATPLPPATVAGASPVVSTLRETVEPRIVAEFSSMLPQSSTISGLPTTPTVVGGVAGAGGGRGGRGGGAGGGGGGRGAGVALDAASTVPPFYWRILSTDVLERSVDRLKWEAVAIDPPVRGLAGGSAPSATVCWVIGREGLVLRTIDGKQFTRVTPPAPADLIAIAADDALRATVTTAGGQIFTTVDGGKSWK
jgi:hypothetical protein